MQKEAHETPGGGDDPLQNVAGDAGPDQREEETAEGSADPQIAALKEEAERLLQDKKQAEDQMLRTMAEFQNFRKRKEAEADQIRQFATERLVTNLLPVLDNFERTLAALENGAPMESVIEGIRLVDKQFRTVLEGQNVRRIAAEGQPFDPEIHEAIATEESHELPENTVINEVESGYRMADKVIRPARVRVSRKP